MKKVNYFIVTALLVCVLLFGGCTKADSADYKICNSNYEIAVKKYVGDDGHNNDHIFKKVIIDESTDTVGYVVDLSSLDAYNQIIYDAIQADSFDEDNESMNFGLLKAGNEYDVVVNSVSNYYAKYYAQVNEISIQKAKDNGVEIPQSVYANLYNKIEGLKSAFKTLANLKTKLIASCRSEIIQNNVIQTTNYEDYLLAYQDVIKVLSDVNKAYQKLHFDYLFKYDSNSGDPLTDGQTQRWVDSAILYCGIYYYIKDMKSSLTIQNAFGHGITGDAGFNEKFSAIYENYQNKVIANSTDSSAIFTYQIAEQKLKSVIYDMDRFSQASRDVKNYLKTHKLTQIDTTRADFADIRYQYEFTQIFDQNVLNLQDMIISYL